MLNQLKQVKSRFGALKLQIPANKAPKSYLEKS
jgi:hypothetical protein